MASVIRGSGDSSFGGNLSIEGVLTYEDVASVDSVGVITARSGIDVGTGTSIFSPSSNVLTLGTNGSEKLRITSTGQLQATGAADVRLTLGSSGTPGTNDSVHIRADGADLKFMAGDGGTTIFERNGTETLRITSGGLLTSTRTSTTAYDSAATTNDSGFLLLNNGEAGHATLQFQSLSGGTAQTGQATISALNESASSKSTSLTFGTRQNSDSTVRERLRLTSDGKLILSMTQRTTPHLAQGDGAMLIEQSYGGNLTALTVRNKDTDAAAATSIGFSLNRTGGDYDFVSGQIKSEKEQSWTTTDSTIDSQMVFSTTEDNTLTERLRITSSGVIWAQASTSGSGNADRGFYHGYSNPSTQSTGITMKTLGIGGGSGPFDTGVSVNAGNAGGVALLFATRNTSSGTATDGAVYLAQFYYDGNNTPLIVHLGGDNWVTWGQTAGNNLQASWSGVSNYTFAMVMVQ